LQSWSLLVSTIAGIGHPWTEAFRRFLAALEAGTAMKKRPMISFIWFALALLVGWHVYVPLHEFLHVAGCFLAGGRVLELQLHPVYGGTLFEKVVPFVRAETGQAGRLVRFDTGDSDLVYFVTDLAPFLLTALAALPCLRKACLTGGVGWLSAGAILLVALVVSLPGDLYEMGSLLVGNLLAALNLVSDSNLVAALRSDDLFALLSEFRVRFPVHSLAWGVAVGASLLMGVLIGGLVLAVSRRLADKLCAMPAKL
jgi:hypothetical protein